jgi:hypothetical protein
MPTKTGMQEGLAFLCHGATEEKSMTVYMVFTRERMRDEKEYEIYKQKNRIAMEGHPIKKTLSTGSMER